MNFRSFSCFLSFFLVVSFLFGQNSGQKESSILLEEGTRALIEKDYYNAIKKLSGAEEIAEKENNPDVLWRAKNFLGQSYSDLGVKNKAFSELSETLDILSEYPDLIKYKPIVYNNLGSLFVETNDFDEALFYLDAGMDILQKYAADDLRPIEYYFIINKAELYNKMEKYDAALEILETVDDADISEYPEIQTIFSLTRAQNLYLSGNLEEAKLLASGILKNSSENAAYYDQILELMGKIAHREKKYGLATDYFNKSITHTNDWKQKAIRYELLADLYRETGNLQLQVRYKDSVILSGDSLASLTNRGLIENTKVQLDIEKYNYELSLADEKQKARNQLFGIVVTSLLLLLATTFFWQKNRLTKQKQEKIIFQNNEQLAKLALEEKRKDLLLVQNQLENEKNLAQTKQEQLKNKISHKNRELATKALFMTERNHLLKKILIKLDQIKEISENKQIRKSIQSLKNELKVEEEWEEYVHLFEQINPNFFRYLKQTHPSLSSSDLRFLSYIYMNFNLQEIANVMVITLDASKKRKQRTAQKMGVETDELLNYLLRIETDLPV